MDCDKEPDVADDCSSASASTSISPVLLPLTRGKALKKNIIRTRTSIPSKLELQLLEDLLTLDSLTVRTHIAPIENMVGPVYQVGESSPAFQGMFGVGLVVVSPRYQQLLWLDWLYTNVLTTLIVWPLAYGIRKLHYFDQVL